MPRRQRKLKISAICALVLLLITGVPVLLYQTSDAVQLSFRKLQLSDPTAAATGVKYAFSFNTNTSGPVGSISFSFCDTYQYDHGDPCSAPAGFDASAATLTNQTGLTGFSKDPASTGNVLIISLPSAANITPQQLQYEFSGMTNPSAVDSYFVRIETHTSTNGSGPETDYGTVAFVTNQGIGISTEVPPYLLFCTGVTIDGFNCGTAAGSFIEFGELSSVAPKAATSQLLASTNAPYGYSVTLAGNTMTAGNNIIPAMSGGTSHPGTAQFGINARANSSPSVGIDPDGPGLTSPSPGYNTPNQFRFIDGDIIASSNDTDDYRKMTVSYLVNVPSSQPAGNYVATVSYICLANF